MTYTLFLMTYTLFLMTHTWSRPCARSATVNAIIMEIVRNKTNLCIIIALSFRYCCIPSLFRHKCGHDYYYYYYQSTNSDVVHLGKDLATAQKELEELKTSLGPGEHPTIDEKVHGVEFRV